MLLGVLPTAATVASGPGHLSRLTVLLAAAHQHGTHRAVRDQNQASFGGDDSAQVLLQVQLTILTVPIRLRRINESYDPELAAE